MFKSLKVKKFKSLEMEEKIKIILATTFKPLNL